MKFFMMRSRNAFRLPKFLGFVCILQSVCNADISDKQFLDDYDNIINEVACGAAAQSQGSEMMVNLSRYATHEEMAKLTFWNYANDFTKTKLEFGEDLAWKRTLVDSLFNIFKAACPDYAVPHGYLNIFREFAMIYLNSVEPRETNASASWDGFQQLLDSCEQDVKPYELLLQAMTVYGITGRKDDVIEKMELHPPQEKVDAANSPLDWVVDNLWWMFSHAMGKCYPQFARAAIIAPKFKSLFTKEILRPLMNRWADPGPVQDFGPVVGNYDILRAQRNIRFCVNAGYLTNGIIELQMVRPLKVGYAIGGVNSVLNRKTGAAF